MDAMQLANSLPMWLAQGTRMLEIFPERNAM